MTHIFISYSKKDIAFARHLRKLLQNEGFAVWTDETSLTPSGRWWSTIERNIIDCAAFIVIMSPDAKSSDWVEREMLVAEDPEHRKPIFPVLLAGKPWARLGNIQHTDMTAGTAAVLPPDFVEALRAVVPAVTGQPTPQPSPTVAAASAPPRETGRRTTILRTAIVVVIVAIIAVAALMVGAPLLNPMNPTAVPTQVAVQPTGTVTGVPATVPPTSPATPIPATSTIAPSASVTPVPPTLTATATTVPATVTPSPTATLIPSFEGTAILTVTTNNQWKTVMHSFDGVEMVLVPPGCFTMGSDSGESDEKPKNEQCFATPFWIDRYEVTNEQFAAFVGQAGRKSAWEGANQPRERIYWLEARSFCARRGVRLPTEAEWEYAARGPDALNYPWGNRFVADNAVYIGNSNKQTADAGSKPGGASWVGALDMSGNVWEWVSTLYQPYPYSPTDGRENGDDAKTKRVIRGGGWGDGEQSLSATNRSSLTLSDADSNIGFRCARSF